MAAAAAAAELALFITTNCNVNNAVRLALNDQGCATCDSLLGSTDYNMKAVSKRMIAPGGTLPGRGAAAGRANRGIPVSCIAERNLRKACFFRNDLCGSNSHTGCSRGSLGRQVWPGEPSQGCWERRGQESSPNAKNWWHQEDWVLILSQHLHPKLQLHPGPFKVLSYDESSGTLYIQRKNYVEPINIRNVHPYYGPKKS